MYTLALILEAFNPLNFVIIKGGKAVELTN